jgi:UDP-N-acetylglucosamine--dolichyl-phosphate N-acetylglucosaminephosphotransferase
MDEALYLAVMVSFAATWITTRKWIRKAPGVGLVGQDMNKPGKPKVAEMGGVCVVFGFVLGMLGYIGILTFYSGSSQYVSILAVLCTVLMTCIIGMIDDILGWKIGLRQWQKPILTLFAALPMMVINAGQSAMTLPVLGSIDWGILYPLLIVPMGIVGASNAYNMLGGYNGLEAGMGVIVLSVLGYVGLMSGKADASILALVMVGALLAFLYFNWYPAKVFPGDTMTYSVGALIACVAILGDMEKIAVLLFIPYLIDFILPMRKRLKVEAFAKVNEDGSLEQPYDRIYDTTHLAIAVLRKYRQKVYERDVVAFVFCFEIIFVGLAALAYY